MKPTFSLANFTPRGGRFLGVLGNKKKVIRFVAASQVGILPVVLCCGRKQLLAPAAKRQNYYSSALYFFSLRLLFFFKIFLVFKTSAFSCSFLLWFCIAVAAGFLFSFSLSPAFCLLLKHYICDLLLFCFGYAVLSRLLNF